MQEVLDQAIEVMKTRGKIWSDLLFSAQKSIGKNEEVLAVAPALYFDSAAIAVVTDVKLIIRTEGQVLVLEINKTRFVATAYGQQVVIMAYSKEKSFRLAVMVSEYENLRKGLAEGKVDLPANDALQKGRAINEGEYPKTNKIRSWIGAGGVVALLVFGFASCSGGTTSAPKPNQAEAKSICKTAISQGLKSPSTAKFDMTFQYNADDDLKYRVVAKVDAQNSFGAMMRQNFSCDLTWSSSAERWTLNRVN